MQITYKSSLEKGFKRIIKTTYGLNFVYTGVVDNFYYNNDLNSVKIIYTIKEDFYNGVFVQFEMIDKLFKL